jgi:hypothetical protein
MATAPWAMREVVALLPLDPRLAVIPELAGVHVVGIGGWCVCGGAVLGVGLEENRSAAFNSHSKGVRMFNGPDFTALLHRCCANRS